ncbi:hypothetical protein LXL04_021892 [Taraxacum kok-saghyz]
MVERMYEMWKQLITLISSIKRSKLKDDDPDSAIDSFARFAQLSAHLLKTSSLVSMTSFTAFSIINRSQVSFMSIPSFHTSPTNRLVTCWSTKYGQHIIGTPWTILSIVEFHPLCVKKPPTAGWARTSSCGAQSTIHPISLVRSSSFLGICDSSYSPVIDPGRLTHRNARTYSIKANHRSRRLQTHIHRKTKTSIRYHHSHRPFRPPTQSPRHHHLPENRLTHSIRSLHHLNKPVTGDRLLMLKSIGDGFESEVGVGVESGHHLGVAEERAVDVVGVEEGDMDAGKT